ncbi:MAG: methionine-gamma-lyase [Cognaticolwellia sp.]|jgi:methionine-gamma-lyase
MKPSKNKIMRPESLMMSHGYEPMLSEGAVKPPIFQTSTFVFHTAEEGKAFFEIAYGLRDKEQEESMGLIYSRLNNPNLEILEERLKLWENADDAAVFASGMAAISTAFLTFLKPGDTILYSTPIYGGTYYFIKNILTTQGIQIIPFSPWETEAEIAQKIIDNKAETSLKMVYVETPANPNNALFDLKMCRKITDDFGKDALMIVDNTFMGPIWQKPLDFGADLVVYSATKYLGGHSDLIAGACLGKAEPMKAIRGMRTFLGNMPGAWTAWLLLRSLETLQMRMERQALNAEKIAMYLNGHPLVEKVYYLGLLEEGTEQYNIYKKQFTGAGAVFSFDIKGGEKEAFMFMNNLRLFKLAVSLGGTESLVEHPSSMTHADVSPEDKIQMNITDKMIRLSIGVEHYDDLIDCLGEAFEIVNEMLTDRVGEV